jgi:hypothetical protein
VDVAAWQASGLQLIHQVPSFTVLMNHIGICLMVLNSIPLATPISVINVTHIICEQCFYTSLSVINVNNLNSALTLIQA